jgi:hypothetical protein
VDLSYKPRPSIIEHEEMTKVVQRHFHDLLQRYGDTMVIDLTDKQGDEGNLSNAFAAEMEKFPDIRCFRSSSFLKMFSYSFCLKAASNEIPTISQELCVA